MNLEFDLLENGFDFILTSIKIMNDDTENNSSKYAILNLSSGVELIFKERLKNEHWSLLFEDINKANKQHLNSGDFKSVNSLTVRARLQEICEIDLKKIDHKNHLNTLRLKRNKIEHFAIKENIEGLKGLIANVLFALIKFTDRELDENLFSERQIELFLEIKIHAIKFSKYAELKLEDLKIELEEFSFVFECLDCCYETMVITDEGLKCLFCGADPDPEVVAQTWEDEQLKCPNCGSNSLINEDHEQVCLACAELTSGQRNCDECGNTYQPQNNGEEYSCSDCVMQAFHDELDNFYNTH